MSRWRGAFLSFEKFFDLRPLGLGITELPASRQFPRTGDNTKAADFAEAQSLRLLCFFFWT